MTTLLVAEHDNKTLKDATNKALTAAKAIGGDVHVLVAGKDSPPAFTEVTNLMAEAMPEARVEWVEGGHVINPAHPAVLGFVDEVLARRTPKTRMKAEPSTA